MTDDQLKALRTLSKADGLTVAEHLRRAVDLYLESRNRRTPRRSTKGPQ